MDWILNHGIAALLLLSMCCSVKGIQPVTSVQLDSGTVWEAPAGAGSVTHLLQQKLVQLQTMTDMSVGS